MLKQKGHLEKFIISHTANQNLTSMLHTAHQLSDRNTLTFTFHIHFKDPSPCNDG